MPKIQYVAFDGKCFGTGYEATEYEDKLIEKLKPSIISTWLDKYAVKANWDKEELRSNPSDLFAHMNNPTNSLLTQAFLESFVENLSAENCAYLAHLLGN